MGESPLVPLYQRGKSSLILACVLLPTLPPTEVIPLKLSNWGLCPQAPVLLGCLRGALAPLLKIIFPLSKSGEGDTGGEVDNQMVG